MDFLLDFLFEVIFEVFGDGFISLFYAFVPNKKISEKARKFIGIISLIVSVVLFIGLFIGIMLLIETKGKNFWDGCLFPWACCI